MVQIPVLSCQHVEQAIDAHLHLKLLRYFKLLSCQSPYYQQFSFFLSSLNVWKFCVWLLGFITMYVGYLAIDIMACDYMIWPQIQISINHLIKSIVS